MLDLTQHEADALLALKKYSVDDAQWHYPVSGSISIPLTSKDNREKFMLDIRRSQYNLAKGTYQNRGRATVVLARLDFGGPSHRNPDGQEVGTPHLHLYREGYGDKWAISVPTDHFSDTGDALAMLDDFMTFCNIINQEIIQ